ncbi:MAG TPA: SPASM domain-containing protein [Rhizomicrobium sp.]
MNPARIAVTEGNTARSEKRWADAAAAYRKALDVNPAMTGVWIQYGHALKRSGNRPAAETAYRAALAREEANESARHHLWQLLCKSGRVRDMLDEHRKLAASEPLPAPVEKMDASDVVFEEREAESLAPAANVCAAPPELGLDEWDSNEEIDRLEVSSHSLGHLLMEDCTNQDARAELLQIRRKLNVWKRRHLASRLGVKAESLPAELVFVGIGTTGLCNASCIHCPTGKLSTENSPRVPMPMPLFTKLIRGIAELHLEVIQMNFGLFGDGLVDPLVVQRARMVRTLIPETNLSVNTNAAAYNRARHKALYPLISMIALHVESLEPSVYNRLMQPLRAERVFPKIAQILEDFPGKVDVSIPVSRLNLQELPAIRDYFLERGARGVHFDTLASRCAEDASVFRSLALDPKKKKCPPRKAKDLIVDCDGRVLMCCQDFSREEPIGNLAETSLLDTLLSAERKLMIQQFSDKRENERKTCSRCYADFRKRGQWGDMVAEALGEAGPAPAVRAADHSGSAPCYAA